MEPRETEYEDDMTVKLKKKLKIEKIITKKTEYEDDMTVKYKKKIKIEKI